MLLGETLESPGGDVGNLRDHIGRYRRLITLPSTRGSLCFSRRLGRTISEVQSKIVPLKSRNEISEPNCRLPRFGVDHKFTRESYTSFKKWERETESIPASSIRRTDIQGQ